MQKRQLELQDLMNKSVAFRQESQRLLKQAEATYAINPVVFTPGMFEAYSTVGGTPHLDGQYTVFGEVTMGMDVVDRIQNAPTGRADRPVEDIRILSVTVLGQP